MDDQVSAEALLHRDMEGQEIVDGGQWLPVGLYVFFFHCVCSCVCMYTSGRAQAGWRTTEFLTHHTWS